MAWTVARGDTPEDDREVLAIQIGTNQETIRTNVARIEILLESVETNSGMVHLLAQRVDVLERKMAALWAFQNDQLKDQIK